MNNKLSNIQQKVVEEIKKEGYLRVVNAQKRVGTPTTICKVGFIQVNMNTFKALLNKGVIEYKETRRYTTSIYELSNKFK